MTEILEVRNLSKHYRNKNGIIRAVDNVSFTVKAGEIVGFLGPNGAGKSTAIKMITGLAAPTDGEVFIMGHSIKTEREAAMKYVGGVIESPDLYLNLSGYANLKYLIGLHPKDAKIDPSQPEYTSMTEKEIDEKRIADVLNMVGLTERSKDLVKKYSLGMKQRLGIAQALLCKPKLLILDEPANGLDPQGIRNIRSMLKYLATNHKMAILVSSHQLAEMQLMCDRVMIISKGVIMAEKTMEELQTENLGGYTVIKTDRPSEAAEMLKEKFGCEAEATETTIKVKVSGDISHITRELIMNGYNIYNVVTEKTSLEDIFLKATEERNVH